MMSYSHSASSSAFQAAASTSAADRQPVGPLRAPLVLRIGLTGHRPDPTKRPNPDVEKLRESARSIFQCIAEAFAGVADGFAEEFDCPSGVNPHVRGILRVISALAAGSDQWLAEEALALGYELQCPLPFSRDEYRNDFKGDDSSQRGYDALLNKATAVLELDGKVDTDAEGKRHPDSHSYEAVGRVVLDQSDLLVAIWDGQDTFGIGGTAQVVNEALQRGIPVVCIAWDQADRWELHKPRWRLFQAIDDKQGERIRLVEQIRELLTRPMPSIEHTLDSQDLQEEYFKERQKSGNPLRNLLLGWWMIFRDLMCGEVFSRLKLREWRNLAPFRADNFVAAAQTEWEESWGSLRSLRPELADHIKRAYLGHYAWANGLSVYYANLYRSSFVLNYLLGALAVVFALFGLVAGDKGILDKIWPSIELVLIFLVLVVWISGWWWRWHDRWIDYRTLAERLRLAQFLALLGGGGQQVSLAGHLASYGNPAATWMHWHYRAVERAAGLVTTVFDESYLDTCQTLWCKSLVQQQKQYHAANEHLFHRLDHRLHLSGSLLFSATLGVCAIHLLLGEHDHGSWTYGLLTLLAATLPALGAAFAAIRSQGEFQRVDRRSAAMCQRLSELDVDLATVSTLPNKLNSVQFRKCAERLTDLMICEMLDWRVVFQDRPLGLPA